MGVVIKLLHTVVTPSVRVRGVCDVAVEVGAVLLTFFVVSLNSFQAIVPYTVHFVNDQYCPKQ